MKLAVFGAGYVGLVTGACFAELGNDVIIVDIDEKRVSDLNKGIIPIYEPGLSDMIKRNVGENRLQFTLDSKKSIINSEIIFIAVGTPDKGDGSTDFTYVLSVAKTIGLNLNGYKVIVDKSTVPVGTADKVKAEIKKYTKMEFDVVSNPEFLKEGMAVRAFMVPDRIIIGSNSKKAISLMKHLYNPLIRVDQPLFITDVKSAEIIKYTSNVMLASRISFMNLISQLCYKVGGNVKDVSIGVGMDKRIGSRFLQAGVGYGGSCFSKDVKSLANTLKKYKIDNTFIESIEKINEKQIDFIITLLKNELKELNNKNIGILGLSFKPNTDDIRDAPSIKIIAELLKYDANIIVYDPKAIEKTKKIFKNKIIYSNDSYGCAKNSDALILATEWDEFRSIDFVKIKKSMKGDLLLDGRNIYEKEFIRSFGLKYLGVGK